MARTNDPDPDPARARLATLGRATPRPPRPDPVGPGRVGWPTAPPGTPAARLRLIGPEPSPGGSRTAPAEPPTAAGGRGGSGDGWHGSGDGWHGSGDGWGGSGDGWGGEPHLDTDLDPDRYDDDPDGREHGPVDASDGWTRRTTERWVPPSWRGARWDPGRAGAVALAAVAAIAAVVAAVGVWSGRPTSEPVPPLPQVAMPGPASTAAPAVGGPIVVSVSGKVARPGLVRLPEGSRVGEAVAAAGGAARGVDLSGLNLAQRLADGEQVAVGVAPPLTPTPAAAPGGARPSGSAPAAGGDKIDLNTATLEQLDGLPGVGPVTAQKILDWRTQNGRFASVDQLQEVGGIGPARLNTLRARVTV